MTAADHIKATDLEKTIRDATEALAQLQEPVISTGRKATKRSSWPQSMMLKRITGEKVTVGSLTYAKMSTRIHNAFIAQAK